MLALKLGIRNWNLLAPISSFGYHWNWKSESRANTARHSLDLPAPSSKSEPRTSVLRCIHPRAACPLLPVSGPHHRPSPSAGAPHPPLPPLAGRATIPLLLSVRGPHPSSSYSSSSRPAPLLLLTAGTPFPPLFRLPSSSSCTPWG